jgi:putative tricarboxylic transport membrane protein
VGKARGRLVAGLAGLVLTGAYVVEMLRTLSFGALNQPGAAVFPMIAAGMMAIASVALIVEQVRTRGGEPGLEVPRGAALVRLLLVAGALVAYVLLASFLGHVVAGLVLALVLVRVLEPGSWMRTIVTAVAIAASIEVVFVQLLGVPLP